MPREKFSALTEPMFYTLLCLREPCCGADIMQKVRQMTGGRVNIGPGTLYHLLEEFSRQWYIQELDSPGRRRVYRITDEGRELLDAEYQRLCRMAADYRRALDGGASPSAPKGKETSP